MRAAIFEREDLSFLAAVKNDRVTGKATAQRFALLQLVRPGHRIPVIRMRADAPQIEGIRRVRGA